MTDAGPALGITVTGLDPILAAPKAAMEPGAEMSRPSLSILAAHREAADATRLRIGYGVALMPCGRIQLR